MPNQTVGLHEIVEAEPGQTGETPLTRLQRGLGCEGLTESDAPR